MNILTINKMADQYGLRLEHDMLATEHAENGEVINYANPTFVLARTNAAGQNDWWNLESLGDTVAADQLDDILANRWDDVTAAACKMLEELGVIIKGQPVWFRPPQHNVDDNDWVIDYWDVQIMPVQVAGGWTIGSYDGQEYVAAWSPAPCHGRLYGDAPTTENGMDGAAERCHTCGHHVSPIVALVPIAPSVDDWEQIPTDAIEQAIADLSELLPDVEIELTIK